MKIDFTLLVAVGGLILTLSTQLGALMLWYANSEKKKYAAERDFNHLRRNQEQFVQAFTLLEDNLGKNTENIKELIRISSERNQHDLVEIKALLLSQLGADIHQKPHDKPE